MKLCNRLGQFKLSGMVASLEQRINYANANNLTYQEFLEVLCEDEENNRRDNSYKKRYRQARLPAHKTLEDFDFNFQPSIDKRAVNDLSTCQFIKEKRNLILVGNPGTGKTHLAIAFALRALAQEYKVLFTTAADMLYQLNMSRADNSYYKKLETYLAPDLLVLDELGFKTLLQSAAEDFFNVIAKRYERGSVIITTNKQIQEWEDIFADKVLASAILDRIVHLGVTFTINGASYRSKKLQLGGEKML